MTDEELLAIADECGVRFGMHPPLRLDALTDGGVLLFVQEKKLTPYGEGLMRFGRMVADKAKEQSNAR